MDKPLEESELNIISWWTIKIEYDFSKGVSAVTRLQSFQSSQKFLSEYSGHTYTANLWLTQEKLQLLKRYREMILCFGGDTSNKHDKKGYIEKLL